MAWGRKMADDPVSSLLQQYYGVAPDTLRGDVQPRVPRYTPQPAPLSQHNLIDSALRAPGQPTVDALERRLQGLETPQGVALSFLENGPVGPLGIARIPNPIRAFHGSPHAFDQFDPAHIGRGEGAQAYGHGLYFAENEGVARSYRDALSNNRWAAAHEGVDPLAVQYFNAYADRGQLAHRGLENELIELVNWTRRMQHQEGPVRRANDQFRGHRYEDMESRLRSLRPEDLRDGAGHMYEVNLHAQPGQFLDYDRPLSGQNEAVRQAIERARLNPRYTAGDEPSVMDLLRWREPLPLPRTPEAANALGEAGIPGLRYLDQGSRTAPQTWITRSPSGGISDFPTEAQARAWIARNPEYTLEPPRPQTSNYVVFNPEIIEILRRYGIAAPVTAAAVLSQYGGEEPAQ